MKLVVASAMVLVFMCPLVWAQNKQVRDASGRLVETWSQRGNTTYVRDKSGSLLQTRTRRGSNVDVRDRNGRLISTEKVGR
ncbi:MAG: hypothetical protein ACP5M0_11860 [Desulfomonilaceae bacterium]